MRYQVVSHKTAGTMCWAIEDVSLTPRLREAGISPALCSLDGKSPLLFKYMVRAYRWLAECERAGLDMGDESGMFRVYTDASGRGGLQVRKIPDGSAGPVVREVPAPWHWH